MSSRKGRKDASRVVREQIAREKRRTRTIITSVAAAALLVVAGLIGWTVYHSQQSKSYTAPAGANHEGTGIVIGQGPVTIDLYEDYQCPACKNFQDTNGSTLTDLINESKVRVIFHPVAYLNRFSTTQYSTRSSAAAGCAAEGARFKEFTDALFAKQPPENSAGLSDDELIDIGASVGVSRDAMSSCVKAGTYKSWTAHVTDDASRAGVTGTPTIKVNGRELSDTERNPDGIKAAVAAAGK
ncbi:thioredoxin domain-containing protein [Micromonospora sp. NPDC048999]|uniref:DsbA family protein n=1 Tax=Micromonospora sp. NPDC048999 TaxID=3155391 RepID=UPI003401AD19